MSKPNNQLAKIETQEPSVGALMQQVVSAGITPDTVAVMKDLIAMKIQLEDRDAAKQFASAFVELQKEIPRIQAIKEVLNRDGSHRYNFAPYEEIMQQVQPLLTKFGFSVSFTTKREEGRITAICTLMHAGGHSKDNEFAVRIGGGPPGANETQADGAAKSFAKRGALSDALNIVVDKDTDGSDARGLGAKITPEQAEDFRNRLHALGKKDAGFLDYADADSFENITESAFNRCDKWLTKAEALPKKPAQQSETSSDEERNPDGSFKF